jgi:hypothetical protein
LPKSFLAVNLSDTFSFEDDMERAQEESRLEEDDQAAAGPGEGQAEETPGAISGMPALGEDGATVLEEQS